MDKEQAIQDFWSGFGIPAYDENTVPDGEQMPYITYNVSTGALGDALILSASVWYHSTSWQDVTQKVHEIAEYIGQGGHRIKAIDGGYLFITQGTPFAQRMADPTDAMIRRIYINTNAEFFTAF